MNMQGKPRRERPAAGTGSARKRYSSPKLTRYGAVDVLTRAGTSTMSEGSPTLKKI
jgi:hypothetical protein